MNDIYIPDRILDLLGKKDYIIDNIGMSNSSVLIFENAVLKIRTAKEENKNYNLMMNLLSDKVLVPKVICDYTENGKNYLLMTKIPGKMVCDDEYMRKPDLLIDILVDAMKSLWSFDISDFPVKNDLSTLLEKARYRVEHGLVNIDDAEPETFGANGFKNPSELFEWLCDNRPQEDLALSHGDFCLPNIFAENKKFSGFVDIEKMGIADRYQDIALCYRSLKHNFDGIYNGINYGEFDANLLFEKLGIEPDWDKIKYYILLDELF